MDTIKATKRPWVVIPRAFNEKLSSINGEHYCIVFETYTVNAELIVTAVNQHDELLDLIQAFGKWAEHKSSGCIDTPPIVCQCGLLTLRARAKTLEAGE